MNRCLIEGLRRSCVLWYQLCTKGLLMERPAEAFCIFNNVFFSSALSHLMKIKKQWTRNKFYNLAYFPSQNCHSPRPKLYKWREGMGRVVAVAAPGRLGTTVFSSGLSWSSSSSRFFFLPPPPPKAILSSYQLGEDAYCTWWHPQLGSGWAFYLFHLSYFPFKVEQY